MDDFFQLAFIALLFTGLFLAYLTTVQSED